jgi:predicted MPP superfamily phosphohydrolase
VTWNTPAEKNVNNQLALQWFKSVGWQLLRNEHRMIKRGTDSILLAGVENWGKTRRFQRKGDLAAALRGAENVPYQILLSHDPSHWDSIVSKQFPSVDLTLSGHTHGGQFGINTDGYKWSPSSWAYPHWMGLCSLEDSEGMRYLYVNPGIGTVGFAGRIGINPEITLLILQANP